MTRRGASRFREGNSGSADFAHAVLILPLVALTLIKQGNLNLSMKFRTALAKAYLVFDATVSINNQRHATFDFQA